jgi:hypothetical protein
MTTQRVLVSSIDTILLGFRVDHGVLLTDGSTCCSDRGFHGQKDTINGLTADLEKRAAILETLQHQVNGKAAQDHKHSYRSANF